MNQSSFLSLNWKDILKGFIVAAITAAVAGISQSLEAGAFPTLTQVKTSALVGLAAGLSYLIKNFFTTPPTVPPAA
jgi:hypothetical protein